MKRIVFYILCLGFALVSSAALAQFAIFQLHAPAAPAACSNSLDFTASCNSQYATVI